MTPRVLQLRGDKKMQIRCFVFALCFLVTIVVSVEAQQRQKAIVTTPSISFNQFPVYVAVDKGFYRQENLDVLIVVMEGTIAPRALIAGDVDYLLAFAAGASAILNGAATQRNHGNYKKGDRQLCDSAEHYLRSRT